MGNPGTIGMLEKCPRCGSDSVVHVSNTLGVSDSYLCLACYTEAPEHYSQGKLMPWDVILDWKLDFWAGNAVKYICRAGKKPGEDAIDDYDKAIHYLRECIRQCKTQKNSSEE